jgi:ABC-type bacteriocin/lantibiotic exporter with double-glycine peptidase domain
VVKGLLSTYIPHLTVSFSNIAFGIILAFIFEWRTALVALGMVPLICISGGVQAAFIAGFSANKDQMYKDAGQIVVEALMNIRTVVSLGSEEEIVARYRAKLDQI